MAYQYVTCCVDAVGDDISELQELADELDNETFLTGCAEENEFADDLLSRLGYQRWAEQTDDKSAQELFTDDFAITCAISRYQGLPALYVQHSRIEHIYVPSDLYNQCRWSDEAEARQAELVELEELMDEHPVLVDPKDLTPAQIKTELLAFYQTHEDTLKEYNIPLVSLLRDWNPVYDTCRAVAKQLDDKWLEPLWSLETDNNNEPTLG